jgi:phytoene synthase
MIRKGSKSFSAASRLFDRTTRESAYMLYAWCRYCDDQVDGQELGFGISKKAAETAAQRLDHLYRQTDAAYGGAPVADPVFEAFRRVVERHGIPRRYPFELLEGFRMDVDEWVYDDLDDTLLYCYHVAGVVGVMMAYVMGVRERGVLHRAADLGIAFQLTNISRDVVEDARAGRVYLPGRWLEEEGLRPDRVADAQSRPAVARVVRRLLAEAERYYDSAHHGLASLPLRAAWAVATARGVYRDIGLVVLERGVRAWDQRVVVSRPRKIMWGLAGGISALRASTLGRLETPLPRVGLWTKPDPP